MATVKSYTSLQQSLKLAEILSLESADMYYPNRTDVKYQGALPIEFKHGNSLLSQEIAAWSLAALLSVLPNDTSLLYFDDAYQMVYDKKPYVISNKFDNPVDACYEIIIRLHELNLL